MNWVVTLARLHQQKVPAVMVTVVSIIGSTPREVGTKMIVTKDQLFGTIGGGNLEFQSTAIARNQLQSNTPQQLRRFPLGAGLGQCCGGLVNLLFEPIVGNCNWIDSALTFYKAKLCWARQVSMHEDGSQVCVRLSEDHESTHLNEQNSFIEINHSNQIDLVLFGAGHVGRAIVNALNDLPVRITWVDSRDEEFPAETKDHTEVICTDSPEAEIGLAKANSYFLVMTHDHSLDQQLTEQILKRDDFAYFGLIGSKSKRRRFETRLQRRGLDAEKFNRMTCPIGISGIQNKQPAMIAIAVVAQIMQHYEKAKKIKTELPIIDLPITRRAK
jgi:xanthine dehydrogenase accessory factor